MKNLVKPFLILVVALGAFAFTSPIKKQIDVKESSITWTGKKLIGKAHTGTINLQSGYLEMDGDKLVGGSFVVDMTSIKNTDLSEEYGAKLVGHLSSDDFFGVAEHPTATLAITKIAAGPSENQYYVGADLTLKGITQAIKLTIEMGDGTATTKLKFDRSKHNVKYGSGSFFDDLGDKAISDMIDLDISLTF